MSTNFQCPKCSNSLKLDAHVTTETTNPYNKRIRGGDGLDHHAIPVSELRVFLRNGETGAQLILANVAYAAKIAGGKLLALLKTCNRTSTQWGGKT